MRSAEWSNVLTLSAAGTVKTTHIHHRYSSVDYSVGWHASSTVTALQVAVHS